LEDGAAKTFRFKAERAIEEKLVDPETGIAETQFKVEPFEMSIPMLALAAAPSMNLQEMNVEFGVEVVELKAEPIKSKVISAGVSGTSLVSSRSLFTPLGKSNPTTMKVNMKIVREIPEGLARITDALTDLLNGIPKDEEPVYKPKALPIEKVHGIGQEAGAMLRARGIMTTADFLKATETPEFVLDLARATKISHKKIENWRAKVKLLEEG
jgi:hypothetical protein